MSSPGIGKRPGVVVQVHHGGDVPFADRRHVDDRCFDQLHAGIRGQQTHLGHPVVLVYRQPMRAGPCFRANVQTDLPAVRWRSTEDMSE